MSAQQSEVQSTQQVSTLEYYQFTGDDPTIGKKRRFIWALRDKAAVYQAAKTAGIHKATAYEWRGLDPQFAQAWDEALEDAADVMETSTYEDALGTADKPGNALLKMFWLKAHRPKYRDKVMVDVSAVQEQIDSMIGKLDAVQRQQLPAVMTEFIGTEFNQDSQEYQPIAVECDPEQKEESPDSSS